MVEMIAEERKRVKNIVTPKGVQPMELDQDLDLDMDQDLGQDQDLDVIFNANRLGKKQTLKRQDQFTPNTGCFFLDISPIS